MRTPRAATCVCAVLAALVIVVPSLLAQETTAERRVPFAVDELQKLDATVGPVRISTLRVTNLGRGYGRGRFLRSPNPPSELSTTLRMAFDVNNPVDEEWRVTFTVEFLDKAGQVIDRASRSEDYEEEGELLNLEHPLLEYVLPLVAELRVTLQASRR